MLTSTPARDLSELGVGVPCSGRACPERSRTGVSPAISSLASKPSRRAVASAKVEASAKAGHLSLACRAGVGTKAGHFR